MSAPLRALSVLVLAGGQGRRLGGSKPEATLGDRSLLERALDLARGLSDDVLLLPRDRCPSCALPSGVRVVADREDLAGPLAGLAAGLAAARHPWSLLLPCDLPFAHAGVARRLAALAAQGPARAVVVRSADGLQPFHALYHRDLLADLPAYLATGRRSLRGLLEAVPVQAVAVESLRDLDPELRFLADVDTPKDLAAARARLAS